MRHIRIKQLSEDRFEITESTIPGLDVGDILTENTVLDLCKAGVPVLSE